MITKVLEALHTQRLITESTLTTKAQIETKLRKLNKGNNKALIREWEKFFQDVPVGTVVSISSITSQGDTYDSGDIIKVKEFSEKSKYEKIWYLTKNKTYLANYDAIVRDIYSNSFKSVELIDLDGATTKKYFKSLGLDASGMKVLKEYKGSDMTKQLTTLISNFDMTSSRNLKSVNAISEFLNTLPLTTCVCYKQWSSLYILTKKTASLWEFKVFGGNIVANSTYRDLSPYALAEDIFKGIAKNSISLKDLKVLNYKDANDKYYFEYEGILNFDLSVWESKEGTIKVRFNSKTSQFYLDINNKYDKSFKSREDFIKFLAKVNAKFVGYDSENDW